MLLWKYLERKDFFRIKPKYKYLSINKNNFTKNSNY